MTASVLIALDTRPPDLELSFPTEVTPPDSIMITVAADEPIMLASLLLHDSLGAVSLVGLARIDDRHLSALIPTASLPGGTSQLVLAVADEVMNVTTRTLMIDVRRPKVYEVALTLESAYAVEAILGSSHEVELTLGPAYEVELVYE